MRVLKTVLCVSVAVLLLTVSASADLIPVPDGDFESGPGLALGPWGGFGAVGVLDFTGGYADMDETGHGSYFAYANAGGLLYNHPGVDIVADTTYTLTLDVGNNGYVTSAPVIELSGNDGISNYAFDAGTYLADTIPAAGKWATWVVEWTPDEIPSAAIGKPLVISLGGGSNVQVLLDNVQLSTPLSVPEPSTLALLATGLIAPLAYAWRKRK